MDNVMNRIQNASSKCHKFHIRVLVFCVLGLLCQQSALAEDRALIIGLSKYLDPALFSPRPASLDVPTVDLDIEMATKIALKSGVQNKHIRILKNEDATAWMIKDAIKNWLIGETQPDDRLFLFYSGHGVKAYDESGDEEDYLDEALLAYDAFFAKQETGRQLRGVVLDDDLYKLFQLAPDTKKYVFIDACFGAGLFRGFEDAGLKGVYNEYAFKRAKLKSEQYSREFEEYRKNATIQSDATRSWSRRSRKVPVKEEFAPIAGLVFLTAAGEKEKAWHSDNGGLFTRAVFSGIVENTIEGLVTPISLKDFATEYIQNNAGLKHIQRPQLQGDNTMWLNPMINPREKSPE